MERKTIETNIGVSLDIDTDYDDYDPFCISELISYLMESLNDGATHVKLIGAIDCFDEVCEVDIQPITVETESDEDYNELKYGE